MSAAQERAAQLRLQAERLDVVGQLEQEAAAAKAAYRDNPGDEDAKAAHRAAAEALAAGRDELRLGGLVVAAEPGAVTVSPPSVASREG